MNVHVKRQWIKFGFSELSEGGGVVCDLVEWPQAGSCGSDVNCALNKIISSWTRDATFGGRTFQTIIELRFLKRHG